MEPVALRFEVGGNGNIGVGVTNFFDGSKNGLAGDGLGCTGGEISGYEVAKAVFEFAGGGLLEEAGAEDMNVARDKDLAALTGVAKPGLVGGLGRCGCRKEKQDHESDPTHGVPRSQRRDPGHPGRIGVRVRGAEVHCDSS